MGEFSLESLRKAIPYLNDTANSVKVDAMKIKYESIFEVEDDKGFNIKNTAPQSKGGVWNKIKDKDSQEERILEKLDEIRTDGYGPKFDDLSKAERKEVDKRIITAKKTGEYNKKENMIKDPSTPGISYQQIGVWVETTLTLYDGLTFEELPEDDQLEILDYEQNVKDIENSSLSRAEKARAIKALTIPDCMNNMSTEKRYQEGKVEDIVNSRLDDIYPEPEPIPTETVTSTEQVTVDEKPVEPEIVPEPEAEPAPTNPPEEEVTTTEEAEKQQVQMNKRKSGTFLLKE